jgi:hypothetical protein
MTTTPGYFPVVPDPERIAQLIAHRACVGAEHDPVSGKLHGCCVVCGVPWPCAYAGNPPARAAELTAQSVEQQREPIFDGSAKRRVDELGKPLRDGLQALVAVERASPAKDGGEQSEWRDSIAAVIAEMRDAIEITPGYNAQSRLREWSTRLNVLWLNAQPLASKNNGAWHFETDHNNSGETIGITIFDHDKRVTTFVCAGCEQDYRFANEICHAHNLASQVRPQSAVQGWQWVPVIATEAMLRNVERSDACVVFDPLHETGVSPCADEAQQIWKTMLAAAPQPPQGEG